MFFQPIFYPKKLIKHCMNHDKPIYDLKKPPKNQNQPESKNQPELRYVFSQILKVKKYLI